jgi:LacI family transcriptional regulator
VLIANGTQTATVNLKQLAEYVGLTPGTVSAVLNNASYSKSIPQHTRDRIFAAAEELNYKPNFFARSLRVKRGSRLISVLTDDMGEPRKAVVISGIERSLRKHGYLMLAGTCQPSVESLTHHFTILARHGVEGFITVNVDMIKSITLPHVCVNLQNGMTSESTDIHAGDATVRSSLENAGNIAATKLIERIAFDAAQMAKPVQRKIFGPYSGVSPERNIVEHTLTAKPSEDCYLNVSIPKE